MPSDFPTSPADLPRFTRSFWSAGALAIWAVVVVLGLFALLAYETTPGGGAAGPPLAAGPDNVEAPGEAPTGYTLAMAAHPRCPCSRASIAELAVLMTHLQGRLTATVWFYTPAGQAEEWAHTGLWKSAEALPGVSVRADPEGTMAGRLGAKTSGQVLLFDPAGQRVFAGGITGSRGHEGDNAGLRAVEALVLGQTTSPATSPVFGCSIFAEAADGSANQTLVAAGAPTEASRR